jgi:serine/threonine protein phosphatase PrpC
MQFTIFQESRKGSRSLNQDRIAYTYSRDALLLVVADGMGGHAGGEIAAQIAVRLFIERFQQEATPILKNPLTFLHETMVKAHTALGSYSAQFSMLETPRTTCVACIVQAGHAYWVHVGDSRLYLYRRGALIAYTRDHSKVQYLVDQGIIRAVDVPDHPDRNKVYSCLGGMVDPVIDLSNRTLLRDGDILVLCTDGLWGPITSDEIGGWLTGAPILKVAPDMMREAERRAGPDGDNLSAIIVRWGPETAADEPLTTITETLPLGEFATQLESTLSLADRKGSERADLSEDEIERAIDEIQTTIKRYKR